MRQISRQIARCGTFGASRAVFTPTTAIRPFLPHSYGFLHGHSEAVRQTWPAPKWPRDVFEAGMRRMKRS